MGACLAALVLAGGCGSGKASSSAAGGSSSAASSSSSGSTSVAGTGTSAGGTTTSSSAQAKGAATKSGLSFTKGKTPNWATIPASTPAQSGLVAITYRDFAIDPDAVKVKVGSTLKWTNDNPVPSNVTSIGSGAAKLASGNFGEGQTFAVKVTKPGVIHYESTNYPTTMNGTIVVVQ